MQNDFAKKLKQIRIDRRLSQARLAQESGVGERTIISLESGKGSPTMRTIIKLANALQITPALLL